MPKHKTRKTSVTQLSAAGPSSSSKPQSSRTVIRRFHTLLKQQDQLQAETASPHNAGRLDAIAKELEILGGLAAYQQMSSIGQGDDRGGGSHKVFIPWLKEQGFADRKGKEKCRLMEVGALKHDNYSSCRTWLENTPIDLRSRHPDIREQDFLLLDAHEHEGKWDAISLSLVLNFVPKAANRGKMLALARTMLRPGGLLFLALPLPCVMNSRYTTMEHLVSLMKAIGFDKVYERWKQHGKMAYWLFRRTKNDLPDNGLFSRKVVLRQGNRNNFAVLL